MTAKLDKYGRSEAEFLAQYDISRFEQPSVTVDILLFSVGEEETTNYRKLPEKVLKVLLIQRGEHPGLGQWALPGGFLGMNETLDEAAHKKLEGETHVDNVYLEQLYTWGDPGRDPRGRVISCSYMALADSSAIQLRAGADAADVRWFTVRRQVMEQHRTMTDTGYVSREKIRLELRADDITLTPAIHTVKAPGDKSSPTTRQIDDAGGIAFDHARILDYGIARLRNKLEYTDIAFNLMPEYFTLTEMQQVYETILDKELLKANFRRKIANFVLETNLTTKDEGHRPAKLYRFNVNWQNAADWQKGR